MKTRAYLKFLWFWNMTIEFEMVFLHVVFHKDRWFLSKIFMGFKLKLKIFISVVTDFWISKIEWVNKILQ